MIICIGAGPGDIGYLTQRGADLIRNADVVAGFRSRAERRAQPDSRRKRQSGQMGYRDQVAQLDLVAIDHHAGKNCVVVFMGDIHFSGFQYLERVERACGHPVESLPGISSAQILASRAKVCFDETTFITFHRRGDLTPFKRHLVHVLQRPAQRHRHSMSLGCGAVLHAMAYRRIPDGARRIPTSSNRSVGKPDAWRSGMAWHAGRMRDAPMLGHEHHADPHAGPNG
jgi:precorrin-6B methylase 1